MSYKGKYKPKKPEKYLGDPTKITYRSLWERRFMVFCDNNDSILSWGSEEVVVPYVSPIDNRRHRYYVDFIVETKNKKGFNTMKKEKIVYDVINLDICYYIDKQGNTVIDRDQIINNLDFILSDIVESNNNI